MNALIKLIQQSNEKELKQSLELFTKMRDKNKISGLMLVSAYNRVNLVKYFKNQITQQSSNGRTALMYAAEHDNVNMINYLIKEGNMQDTFGFSALMLCVIRDSRQFAQQLMKHNVDLCKRLKRDYGFYQSGMNALLIAALHENIFFIKLLLPFEICQVDVKQIDYVYFLTKNLDIAQMLYSEIKKKKQQSPSQLKSVYNPPSVTAQFKIYLGVFTEIDVEKVKIIHFSEPDQEELIKNQKIDLEEELENKLANPDNVNIHIDQQKVQQVDEQQYDKLQNQLHETTYDNTQQILITQQQDNDEEDSWGNQNKDIVQSPVTPSVQSVNTPSSLNDQREKMRRLMLFRFSNAKNYLAESSESNMAGEYYKLSQNTPNTNTQLLYSDTHNYDKLTQSQSNDIELKQLEYDDGLLVKHENQQVSQETKNLSSEYIDLQLQNSIQDSSRLVTSNNEANYIFLKSSEDVEKAFSLKNKYIQEELIEEANDAVKQLETIQNELSMSSHLSQIVKGNECTISQLQNKNTNLQQVIQEQIQQLIEKDQVINDLKLENQDIKNNFQRHKKIIDEQIQKIFAEQRKQYQKQLIFYGVFFVMFNAYIFLLSYFIQHTPNVTQLFNRVFYKK